MEFTGINLVLILLAPLVVIFIIVLLLYPLQIRLFDREKPLKKQLKDKGKELREKAKQKIDKLRKNVIDKGECPTKEQVEEFRGEMKALQKEYRHFSWDTTKEIIKVHNEESGFSDTIKELKADRGSPATFLYLGSMLLTPVALPIIVGLSTSFLHSTAGHRIPPLAYLILLVLPAVGCWFGYRGYVSQKKKVALLLCLCINALYAIFLIYGILRLG